MFMCQSFRILLHAASTGISRDRDEFTVEALSDLLVHCVEIRGKFRDL